MTTNRDRARYLIGASADCIEVELAAAEQRGAQRERAKTLLDVAKRLEAMADEEGARDVGGDVAQARRSIAKQGAYLTAAAVVRCFDEDESGTHAKEEA
jgi:hypothetical protein